MSSSSSSFWAFLGALSGFFLPPIRTDVLDPLLGAAMGAAATLERVAVTHLLCPGHPWLMNAPDIRERREMRFLHSDARVPGPAAGWFCWLRGRMKWRENIAAFWWGLRGGKS